MLQHDAASVAGSSFLRVSHPRFEQALLPATALNNSGPVYLSEFKGNLKLLLISDRRICAGEQVKLVTVLGGRGNSNTQNRNRTFEPADGPPERSSARFSTFTYFSCGDTPSHRTVTTESIHQDLTSLGLYRTRKVQMRAIQAVLFPSLVD